MRFDLARVALVLHLAIVLDYWCSRVGTTDVKIGLPARSSLPLFTAGNNNTRLLPAVNYSLPLVNVSQHRRLRKRKGCACKGLLPLGCTFTPFRINLRGGRSKRGGRRVKAALDASGGKSAAAARFPVGKFASSGGPTARADGSNSTTERGWVHGGRLGGQERRWEKGKKTKKKSHRQLAMEARAKHKESIASIWDDVDPTRDPELEFWYEREKHDNITLPGMRSYEEIVADSDWHKLIRKAHEIEHAKEVTSWAEIEECWSNGTYFRLPEGLKRYVDSVHEEGAVSHVFPLGYSEPGQDLIKAAQTNNVSAVRELLDEGTNPDYQDWAGQTALHVASLFGHVEVVKTLLDRGAAPSIANWCNYTALDYALWSQYPINVTFVGCDYDYPAPCRDKTLRRKVKAALREAGAYNGWGKNWEWAAEVERRGLLEQFDSYVHRMPLDLLQALVDCNIVRRGDVSHRFPSSIHSGVSPWIDAARQAGIDVPTTYAYEMVDDEKLAEWGMAASGETAEAGGGGGGGSGGTPTVADFLHRLRTAPFATDSEEPDDPTTSE